jgi:hypothetical protein
MRFRTLLPALVIIIGLGCIAYALRPSEPAKNPDPNHTHADFAVWVDGQEIDFSGDEYMEEKLTPEQEELLRTQTGVVSADAGVSTLKQYLHLHDNNGRVMHRHKPGLTLGQFFRSIGVTTSKDGLNACLHIPHRAIVCEDEALHKNWSMYVNGEQRVMDFEYVFQDLDHILITNASEEAEVKKELGLMTDDSCLYSRTCPERGEPPTENCIADPTVPCKQ